MMTTVVLQKQLLLNDNDEIYRRPWWYIQIDIYACYLLSTLCRVYIAHDTSNQNILAGTRMAYCRTKRRKVKVQLVYQLSINYQQSICICFSFGCWSIHHFRLFFLLQYYSRSDLVYLVISQRMYCCFSPNIYYRLQQTPKWPVI